MEIIIATAAFFASLLTLFSGFGLGTLLTPIFGLFFPIHFAVALTGIVHLLNNLFKLALLGKKASRDMVLKFGVPSVVGGLLGAALLASLSDLPVVFAWFGLGKLNEVTFLKLAMALLMVFFALMELLPALKNLQFPERFLRFGGLLSGFFGGLSGHQGALRSAFLLRSGLNKEAFIATGVTIACMVDLTRLPIYFARFDVDMFREQWRPLLIATLSAFAGAYLGAKYLQKTTINAVKWFTAVMIVVIAVLLGMGII